MKLSTDRIDDLLNAREPELSPHAKDVARRLAREPQGILRKSAASIIAPMISGNEDEAKDILLELSSSHLLRVEEIGSDMWLVFDHAALGLTPEEKSDCLSVLNELEAIGTPHSPEGMASLRQFFQDDSPIHLVLSITSHNVFTDLQSRSDRGGQTFLVFPSRSHVPENLHVHYDEVLRKWIAFLRNGNSSLRSQTTFRVATVECGEIYTSGMSSRGARINFFRLDAASTRDGIIISAPASTSLYALYSARATEVWASASPLWALEKQKYVLAWFKKAVWPTILVISALTAVHLFGLWVGSVVAALATGLLREWVASAIGAKKWASNKLFQR